MFPTVSQQPIREDRSSEKEKVALANGTRDAVNMTSRVRTTLTTAATGVFTTIWTSEDMVEGSVWAIDLHVFAHAIAGGPGRNRYDQSALFYREPGGSTTQQGLTVIISVNIESIAAADVQFTTVGNAVALQVKDDGIVTFDWDAMIEVREVK